MAEPTLVDVFGAGAVQDANTITIQKSALVAQGLVATANNTPEAILVGILLIAQNSLTEAARATDTATRNLTVNYSGQDLIQQNGQNYRRDAYSILLYKQTNLAQISPNDY